MALIFLLIVLSLVRGQLPQNWTQDQVKQVCDHLKQTGSIIQCKTDDFLLKPAKEYIKAFGLPDPTKLTPTVILPGLGGSALQAMIDKTKVPHWWCFDRWYEWFRLWLPIEELIAQDCWFDNLQIFYDPVEDNYTEPVGVQTDVVDFGGLSGIAYMDYWFGFPLPFTTYYSALIASLEAVGYIEGKTLFGAPFDWRRPVTFHEQRFYPRLQKIIETAYNASGGQKVNIITHSLGGPTFLAFLNLMTQEWRDTHIEAFLPIAAPWSGSPKALRTVISGDNFGVELFGYNLLNTQKVAQLSQQAGGIVQLIPYPHFYSAQTFFVSHQGKNYSAHDFGQLFNDAGKPITALIHASVSKTIQTLSPPRVTSYCIYGNGVPTEQFFNYTGSWEDDPIITYSNKGDGTVPEESLKACLKWTISQRQPVHVKEFNLVSHGDILQDPLVFQYILGILIKN